jgi:Asp-tRNA(Asn)/Glu-tRNA(Gln) amidotransferase A subunit family amidase
VQADTRSLRESAVDRVSEGHEVAGLRSTIGAQELDHVADSDGAVAARLRAAGAVVLGHANAAAWLADFQTDNLMFGRTNNPWDVERTAGGSSGGAAAAVAAGLTPVDVGSDLTGSIRLPASFCGVYGLKTTEHRVALTGFFRTPGDGPRPCASCPASARSRATSTIWSSRCRSSQVPMGATWTWRRSRSHAVAVERSATCVWRLSLRWPALSRRDAIFAAWESYFGDVDALLLPAAMTTAFAHCPYGAGVAVDGKTVSYFEASQLLSMCNVIGLRSTRGRPCHAIAGGRARSLKM